MVVDIMHLDSVDKVNALEDGVPKDPRSDVVHVDVGKEFMTKEDFMLREHMLQLFHTEATILGF